jgi:thiosulfate reductase/polysulfide reductase chain A
MHINTRELRNRGAVAFPGRPYIEDRLPDDAPVFPTDSGKIELYSQQLKGLGADPLPRYTPVTDPPAGYVRLIYGRAPVHSFARSQNNEVLSALMTENEVWLHTQSARDLGVHDGERVRFENTEGIASAPVRVKVTEGIRRDCAYMVHGFGQRSKALHRAYGRGASDTELMTQVKVDPLMGGTGMRVNFVRPVKDASTR